MFQNLVSGQQSWLELDIIITWVEVEEVEVTVEQVEQEEERGEAQILNIKYGTNPKYEKYTNPKHQI